MGNARSMEYFMTDQQLLDEAKIQMKLVYDRGINIYMYINKTKKLLKKTDHFPPQVIISVCGEYIYRLDTGKVENTYLYFIKVLRMKSAEWHANQQIQEHQKVKNTKMSESVKSVLKGMFE